MSSTERPGEDSLIARFFAPIAGTGGLGLTDDAACLTPKPGHDLVLTADALVERVHFLPEDAPGSIARKALGVNVSDLAAKGADPAGFLLSLALPGTWTEEWLTAFAAGLGEASRDFACPLLGGDTVKTTGPLTLSVTAVGEVPAGRMVRRTSARVGDLICVTGTIGDAALGLKLRSDPAWAGSLSPDEKAHLADRYLHPRPRHRLAAALRDHASAAMDVSDGLAGDLAKMMRVSGASALIEADRVPLSGAAARAIQASPDLLDLALTGGDDYEILCTVSEMNLDTFRKEADRVGIALSVIGRVVPGRDLPVFRMNGLERRYDVGSYQHF
ncbi:thiamine-phosphate kinase [Microvirga lotononidis]|uniref:Thiamine-monophosphate kinase n=1 Tax=Microvirga lotononidis TaxID=864069 RepID=I4Z097_9HYPH|nr:thiamine-phosphate kinase [Microvirga lotononidis]EIM29639.1 thiamine-monophosphate kinase [Microvirga lotononidis]WQO27058.1 thiamine-phosphate kinase [Microvirga lotononidis]